jgi:ketopantoate reductase
MRMIVIGAGAIGGTIGGRLPRSGDLSQTRQDSAHSYFSSFRWSGYSR